MATEWFFERDGERHGPVSSSNLKQLAANGKIRPDDLVWQSEMGDWMPARSVKGLFGVQSQSTPPPLPKEKTPVVPVSDQLKAGASVIGSSAKVAGQLAAKQTVKTNILSSSLPKAFAELGKNIFENSEATSELESCYAEINGLIERIENVTKKTSNQPEAKTFTEKAKAFASTTGAAAQTKMLQHKLKQQFSRLGKLVFEDSDHGPESLRSPITKLKDRLSELDVEIGELKKQMSAQKEAAGKMVSSVAASGGSLLFKMGVVGTLAVFCAPVGLALIWLHPTWDKSRKLRWTGVSVACLLVFFVLGRMQESAVLKELAKANRLWDDGDQTAAIDGYREVLPNVSNLPQADRSRVFRRVIEFDCEHDNLESAKKLIGKARRVGIELSLTNPTARTLLADIEREQAQKKQETAKAIRPPETDIPNDSDDASSGDSVKAAGSSPLVLRLTPSEEAEGGWYTPNMLPKIDVAPPVSDDLYDKIQLGMGVHEVRELLGGNGQKWKRGTTVVRGHSWLESHVEYYLAEGRPDVCIYLFFQGGPERGAQREILRIKQVIPIE